MSTTTFTDLSFVDHDLVNFIALSYFSPFVIPGRPTWIYWYIGHEKDKCTVMGIDSRDGEVRYELFDPHTKVKPVNVQIAIEGFRERNGST